MPIATALEVLQRHHQYHVNLHPSSRAVAIGMVDRTKVALLWTGTNEACLGCWFVIPKHDLGPVVFSVALGSFEEDIISFSALLRNHYFPENRSTLEIHS